MNLRLFSPQLQFLLPVPLVCNNALDLLSIPSASGVTWIAMGCLLDKQPLLVPAPPPLLRQPSTEACLLAPTLPTAGDGGPLGVQGRLEWPDIHPVSVRSNCCCDIGVQMFTWFGLGMLCSGARAPDAIA